MIFPIVLKTLSLSFQSDPCENQSHDLEPYEKLEDWGMEHWGYVRVSTTKETQAAAWEAQRKELRTFGAQQIFEEEASAGGSRPVFESMIRRAEDRAEVTGQIVVIHVTKMDRGFRDLEQAIATVRRSHRHNVHWALHDISHDPLDPRDAAQNLHFHILAAIGQFEKDRFAERRAVGIEKAKREGRYKGRAPTARAKTNDVLAAKERGLKPAEIAKLSDISVASVYRILSDANAG